MKRLFWDIETSPNLGYFWNIGYKVRLTYENILKERAIICICWKWEDKKKVHSLTWDNGDDKKMVTEFLPILKEADEAVAHNGDKFDMKWFNTQCLKYGLVVPEIKTVDTLVIARRRFKFNSNRLDYLGQLLLGKGKIHTEYQLWKDVCAGDKEALRKMVVYCKNDVGGLLQPVWEKLQKFHKPKSHMGVMLNRDKWTCPECGSKDVHINKTYATTAGSKRYGMMCKSCGRYYTIPSRSYLDYLEKVPRTHKVEGVF